MNNNIEKVIKKFKIELEEVLDEYFPKIEEESPEKIANKRGQDLALYSTAVLLFTQALHNKEKEVVLRIRRGLIAETTIGEHTIVVFDKIVAQEKEQNRFYRTKE